MTDARNASSSGATATLLLLADGRLPTGGHVHSGGLEAAVADGRVSDIDSLASYLQGRLWTAGLVDAALAAASWARCSLIAQRGDIDSPPPWAEIEAEAAARCASPALRQASRSHGRGLLRCGSGVWPGGRARSVLDARPAGVLWPVALGIVAADAGVGPPAVGVIAALSAVTGPAWAAVRLLAVDPFQVAALLANLGPDVDLVAHRACDEAATKPARDLPSHGAPLCELAAQAHLSWEARLFAS